MVELIKVTDEALLSELNATPALKKVEDPELLAQLNSQEQTFGGELLALGETALTMGSDLAGKAVAGIATPFMAAWDAMTNEKDASGSKNVLGDVTRKINLINDFIRIDPKTERGKETLESIAHIMDVGIKTIQGGIGAGVTLRGGGTLEQATDTFNKVRDVGAGQAILESTGSPALATLGDVGTDAALMLAPLKFGKARTSATPEARPTAAPAGRTRLSPSENEIARVIEKDFRPNVSNLRMPGKETAQRLEAMRDFQKKAEDFGGPAIVGDIGEANVKGLAKTMGAATQEGKRARANIIERDAYSRDRMKSVVNETLFKGESFVNRKKTIETEAQTKSTPAYYEFYSEPKNYATSGMLEVLSEPVVGNVIKATRDAIYEQPLSRFAKDKQEAARMKRDALAMFKKDETRTVSGESITTSGKLEPQGMASSTAARQLQTGRTGTTTTLTEKNVVKTPGQTVTDFEKQIRKDATDAGPAWRIDTENLNPIGIDYLKRVLGDTGANLKKAKKTNRAAPYFDAQTRIRDEAIVVNPKYKTALDIWSEKSGKLDALDWGKNVTGEINSGVKSAEAALAEFNAMTAYEKSLARIGVGEKMVIELDRRPNTKTGETPSSVHTTFVGSPAQKELMKGIFENERDYANFMKLSEQERAFNETLSAVNVSNSTEVALQRAFQMGNAAEVIASMSTDVLFSISGNRFAYINLLKQLFTQPKQFFARLSADKTASLTLDRQAVAVANEIIRVLEAKQQKASIPKELYTAAKLENQKMWKWLQSERNRRILLESAALAAVAEQESE